MYIGASPIATRLTSAPISATMTYNIIPETSSLAAIFPNAVGAAAIPRIEEIMMTQIIALKTPVDAMNEPR